MNTVEVVFLLFQSGCAAKDTEGQRSACRHLRSHATALMLETMVDIVMAGPS